MLKPIDIHNAEFKRSFKGYNEEEVDNFLAKILSKYESIYQENKELYDRVKELEEEIRKYQSKEDDIYGLITLTRETVTEAKQIAAQHGQSVVDEATAKAKAIIEEAKGQAEQILRDSERQLEQKQRRIKELVSKEQEFKNKMRTLMETFWAMLEDLDAYSSLVDDEVKTTKVYKELATADAHFDAEEIDC